MKDGIYSGCSSCLKWHRLQPVIIPADSLGKHAPAEFLTVYVFHIASCVRLNSHHIFLAKTVRIANEVHPEISHDIRLFEAGFELHRENDVSHPGLTACMKYVREFRRQAEAALDDRCNILHLEISLIATPIRIKSPHLYVVHQ